MLRFWPFGLTRSKEPISRRFSLSHLRRGSAAADTVEASLARFFTLKDAYLRTENRHRTLAVLEQHKPLDGWKITTGLLVGVGSFASDEELDRREQSMIQLIVFLDIIDNIRSDNEQSITTFAQEPRFHDTECEVLEYLHVNTLLDPQAQKMSGPGVFVFAPACPADVEFVAQCAPYQPTLNLSIPIKTMIKRDLTLYMECTRKRIEDDSDSGEVPLLMQRLELHHQRVELLCKFQETHWEIEIPQYRHRLPFMLNIAKPLTDGQKVGHGSTCELCVAREGRRFEYRDTFNDPSSGSRAEW